jgi:hypothetical protein
MLKTLPLILIGIACSLVAQTPRALSYTGGTTWDGATGTLSFTSSGTMPLGQEEFFWSVPTEVKRIAIAANVTVRGGFRVPYRTPENPLRIEGADRETSVIFGTEEERWTTAHGIADNSKWKFGAVSVLEDATVYVSDLTSLNPRGYHISGYANRSVLHVARCKLVDSRAGNNNNSDGFIGSDGSTITDSFISTGDDAIKAYRDITIRNVVIEHRRNGAPIQFGWGGDCGRSKAIIENLTIKGVSPDKQYNMAPFTWEDGSSGTRDVTVQGLKVETSGMLWDEEHRRWVPIGLLELKPSACTLNLTISKADIATLVDGIFHTKGIIKVDGRNLQ